ncbi:hypothetical protein HZH68_011459 [Vespula germanica]|uniref:Uncharacterized protein n=1 Tax=Vespula germanica TaxID=30212 RepID=A0A834JQQ5_VESGE|nr:hypothetical protein HZH68_011459 [Vespula germanica]
MRNARSCFKEVSENPYGRRQTSTTSKDDKHDEVLTGQPGSRDLMKLYELQSANGVNRDVATFDEDKIERSQYLYDMLLKGSTKEETSCPVDKRSSKKLPARSRDSWKGKEGFEESSLKIIQDTRPFSLVAKLYNSFVSLLDVREGRFHLWWNSKEGLDEGVERHQERKRMNIENEGSERVDTSIGTFFDKTGDDELFNQVITTVSRLRIATRLEELSLYWCLLLIEAS